MASYECGVCIEKYNDGDRRPRCLSCGHTLCSACLAAALDPLHRSLLCPFCRLPHATPVTTSEDVPVNFTVVSLLQDVAQAGATQRSQALLAEVKHEAIEYITTQLMTCNSHQTQLKHFQHRLGSTRKAQEVQVVALRTLLARHEHVLADLTSTAIRLSDVLTRGHTKRAELEAAQARINSSNSLLEVTAAHEEDRNCSRSLEEWSCEAQEILRSQVEASARQLEQVTGAALQSVVQLNMDEVNTAFPQYKLDYSIEHTSLPSMQTRLECEGQGGSGTVSELVQEMWRRAWMVGSGVWAVVDDGAGGRPRCAKVTIVSSKLYLSALREGEPPRYSHTLPYDDVRGLVDESCLRVFLEVSWDEQPQGRVCIKLSNTAARTTQFFSLCSGERGPSYLDTRLLEVESRGRSGERVWGGDYQNNDGSGGAALPGLTRGPLESQSVMAGLVAGYCYSDDHRKPAHFVIYTLDCPVMYEECPLGRVEEGVAVVRAAAALRDITAATITDCGIIVSL